MFTPSIFNNIFASSKFHGKEIERTFNKFTSRCHCGDLLSMSDSPRHRSTKFKRLDFSYKMNQHLNALISILILEQRFIRFGKVLVLSDRIWSPSFGSLRSSKLMALKYIQ